MAGIIEETSRITAKGQTTVPKSVRRALGVDYGGKIAFRVEGGIVTMHNAEAEHRDHALEAFLALIDKDIDAGRHVRKLPSSVEAAMRRAIKEVPIDLDEELDGDVVI